MNFEPILYGPLFIRDAQDINLVAASADPVDLTVSVGGSSWTIPVTPVLTNNRYLAALRMREILSSVVGIPGLANAGELEVPMVTLSAGDATMSVRAVYGAASGKTPTQLAGHWLSWRDQVSMTHAWGRERLTFLAGLDLLGWQSGTYSVKAKIFLSTGDPVTVTLASGTLQSGCRYVTVDASYATIAAAVSASVRSKIRAWDVSYSFSGTDSQRAAATINGYPLRLIIARDEVRVKEFVFCNSFGVEDRVYSSGRSNPKLDGSSVAFLSGASEYELRNDSTEGREVYSGRLGSARESALWLDFLKAHDRYILASGGLARIIVDSQETDLQDNALGSVKFTYHLGALDNGRYFNDQEGLGDYDPTQRHGALYIGDEPPSEELPSEDLFFLKTRLDEFPVADLSEEYLFLVQDPLTLEWCNAPLSDIKEWLQQVIIHEDVHVWDGPWEDYSAGVAGYALAASLGKDLCDRIVDLEEAPAYQLPIATDTRLGGIKVGSGLSITQDGVLSADDACYFEQDPDYSGEAHLKSAYTGLRIPGLRFGEGREAFDLEVVEVDGKKFLHTPLPFYSDDNVSGGGISDDPGAQGGDTSMVVSGHQATFTNSAQDVFTTYDKEKIDELVSAAGTVDTVAGVSPVGGDIPTASLKNALGISSLDNDLTTIGTALRSLQSQVDSVAARDMFDELTVSSLHADNLAASAIVASTSVTSPKFYFNANTYLELDSDGYVHLVNPTGKGFYADGFVSAGGASTGGGASGVDLDAVWASLKNTTPDAHASDKISTAHIPDMASTYSYVKTSAISDMATKTWVVQQGYLTDADLTVVGQALKSLQSQVDSVVTKDAFDELTVSSLYADNLAASAIYAAAVVLDGEDLAEALSGLAGTCSTLEGYFDGSGSAKTSVKLKTARTLWGQSFDGSGNVSGNMSSVGSISMNGSISGATTIVASTSVTSPKFYFNANTYLELDSDGYVHLVNPTGKGFYADGFVSAGGASTGGGASGVDLDAVWASLKNTTPDAHASDKISTAHIPDMASTYSYVKTSAISDMATKTWVVQQGYLTDADLTVVGQALKSLQSQVDSVAARDMFDELKAASVFADTVAASAIYGALHGNADTATDADTLDGQHGSYYATAASVTTLQGYFSNGVANNAAKLNGQSASYYATAASVTTLQGYFTNGVANNADKLDGIHASGLFTAMSSSAATNLSVTIGGTNKTATLYATYDSASENIADKFGIVSGALQSLQKQIDSVASRSDISDYEATTEAKLDYVCDMMRSLQSQIDSVASRTADVSANGYFDMLAVGGDINAGNVFSTGQVTGGVASDLRLKDRVKAMTVEEARRVVEEARPVTFVWNEKAKELGRLEGEDVGVIAQEVEAYLPQAVSPIWGEFKRVSYEKFIPALLKVCKEQERRIRELENKLK